MHREQLEIGSYFGFAGIVPGKAEDCVETLPAEGWWLASGRDALSLIARSLPEGSPLTLHVPTYFCPKVTTFLESFFHVAYYEDSPFLAEPSWDSLKVSEGDLVLLVNYFGLRGSSLLAAWAPELPEAVRVIEDHTHAPLRPCSMGEGADYVIASLRKHLPLPDGGFCFSPKGQVLAEPGSPSSEGLRPFLEASWLKHLYLEGVPVEKSEFLNRFAAHETFLSRVAEPRAMSPLSRLLLDLTDLKGVRRRRAENCGLFRDLYQPRKGSLNFELLLPQSLDDVFNPVLAFPGRDERDRARGRLIDCGIYPPIHWDIGSGGRSVYDLRARDDAGRVLTLPLDQRYGEGDVRKVFDLMGTM